MKLKKINEHFQLEERFPTSIEFIKLIARVIYVAHVFGYGFNLVSVLSRNDASGSWLRRFNLEDVDWVEQYVSAIYFGIITMSTIGYGDIYPINKYEKIFVIIMTFISCGLFAYCVNSIGEVLKELKQKSIEFT